MIGRATKGGQCCSGSESDRGRLVHAVPGLDFNDHRQGGWGPALCGTSPGRRSVGWVEPFPADAPVTCTRCLKRMERK